MGRKKYNLKGPYQFKSAIAQIVPKAGGLYEIKRLAPHYMWFVQDDWIDEWSIDMAFKQIEFVTITIPENELDKADAWFADIETELDLVVTDVLRQGYKVSFSYHNRSDMCIAALTGTENAQDNQNKSMSAWGTTAMDALGLLLYKHVVMSDNGAWVNASPRSNRG